MESTASRARRFFTHRLGRARVRDVAIGQWHRAARTAPGPGRKPARGGRTSAGCRTHERRCKVVFIVSAVNRSTGKSAWTFELPAEGPFPSVHEKHNLASPSPVSDGERVYAWFATGQIAAIDLNGRLVWKKHLGADYSPFEINWGHGSSPVVYKDHAHPAVLSRACVVLARTGCANRRRAMEVGRRERRDARTARRWSLRQTAPPRSSSTRAPV